MARIDRDVVKKLTQLSRIECNEKERDELQVDLKNILVLFEELQQVDTEGVAPCNTVLEEISNVMREDAVGETLTREEFLVNCPSIGGMVRVPTILPSGSV